MRTALMMLLLLSGATVLAGDHALPPPPKANGGSSDGLLPVPRASGWGLAGSAARSRDAVRRMSPLPADPLLVPGMAGDPAPSTAQPAVRRPGETSKGRGLLTRPRVLGVGGAVVALAAGAAVAVFLWRRRRTPIRQVPPLALFGLEGKRSGGGSPGVPQRDPTESRRAA
jgi:hypothetical protein